MPRSILLLAALVLYFHTSVALRSQEYSHGDPTPDEQYMLELINRARANPTEEGIRLIDTEDPSVQAAYTYFNINKAATKQAFTTYPQRPPLAFHPALIQAARVHTADMVANNFQGHVGSNGSTLDQRYAAAGYVPQGQWGENVSAYSNSVWYGHCGLNVDWGTQNQIDLGHRSNIMNFKGAVYTEIGIGITKTTGGLQQGTVGPYVITQDFGIRTARYITGVVYNDKNSNGFYDVGEGLEGVRVQPSRGTYYAVTSTSGGYAIPFSGSGSVTIVASGGPLTSPITQQANFGSDNIKVDFVPASLKPGSITLLVPANAATVNRIDVAFDWNPTAFAEEYELQVASAQSFAANTIVFTSRKATTGGRADMPECGKTYYWRVRAHNSVGAGPWSTAFSFSTTGRAPNSPSLTGPTGAFSVDHDKTQTFTWAAVNGAASYHIRASTQANMSSPFFQDSAVTSTSVSVSASLLPSTGTFYWQVRSNNECGWSIWSSTAQATATLTSVDELRDPVFKVTAAPNPMSDDGAIRINTLHAGEMQLTIVDATGAVVINAVINAQEGVGNYHVPGLNVLGAGSYTVIVNNNNERASARFIKL